MFDPAEIRTSSFAAVPAAERLEALNAQLSYAVARSPYYLAALGQDALRLSSLSELPRLPFLTPETLRAEGRRLVCVPASEVARIVSLRSSGTAGRPKRLYFTRGDLERTVAFFAEGMGWMAAPGDRVAVLMPCGAPDGIGDLLCRALDTLGARPLAFGLRDDMAALAQELLRSAPQVLVGLPWQVRLLCLLAPALRPRAVLLSADYIPETLPPLLEKRWHCRALSHFGMTETGYGCAVEHPSAPGMVLRADELFAEIVDPDSGAPLPPGAPGELVLTTLRREAMPLIRYRTGDLAVMDGEGRIGRVFGRRGVPQTFYTRQDRLCALPWLYDYAEADGCILASVSPEAPPDSRRILSAAADGAPVELRPALPSGAVLMQLGKRAYSPPLY